MTERPPTDSKWALPGRSVDRYEVNDTTAPVAHVRTRCPALIATLVAMARASKDAQGVDGRPGVTASRPRASRTRADVW